MNRDYEEYLYAGAVLLCSLVAGVCAVGLVDSFHRTRIVDRAVEQIARDIAAEIVLFKTTAVYNEYLVELRGLTELSNEDYLNRHRVFIAMHVLGQFEERMLELKADYTENEFGQIVSRIHTFIHRVIA